MDSKPSASIEHVVNWYVGNYVMSPDNALREDDALLQKSHEELEALTRELEGRQLTHKEFLGLVKERGIHDKYYRYRKYREPHCDACEKMGVPRHQRLASG